MPADKPSFLDEIFWAFDLTDPDTEIGDLPSVGGAGSDLTDTKRQSGWVLEEVPPYKFFNWFWHRISRTIQWLRVLNGGFDSLADAFGDDLSSPDLSEGVLFRVEESAGYGAGPFEPHADSGAVPSSGNDITDVATDGQIVVVGYDTFVAAYDPDDLTTPLWTYDNLDGDDTLSVECDGKYVYAGYSNGFGDVVRRLDRTDGSELETATLSTGNASDMAADSEYLVVVEAGQDEAQLYESDDLTAVTALDHKAVVHAVAMGNDRIVVAGEENGGGEHMTVFDKGGSFLFAITLAYSSGTPQINDVVTDGVLIYSIGAELDEGGDLYSMWAHRLSDGELVWRVDANIPDTLCVDDRHVYAGQDPAGSVRVYDKLTGAEIYRDNSDLYPHNPRSMVADGFRVWGGADDELRCLYAASGTKLFVRVSGNETGRRPFFNLAVPYSARGF